jgi:hypothetical protein
MNGDDKPQTNKGVIVIVILTVAICTLTGVLTFAYCMAFKVNPDGVIVTAFSSIVTACLGYLAGVLSKTSPTETTKQPPHPLTTDTTKVEVMNTPETPVQTEEVKP